MKIQQFLRSIVAIFLIFNYIGISLIAKLLISDEKERRRFFIQNGTRFCRIALQVFRIDVKIENEERFHSRNHLIIANHLSYLDAMLFFHILPTCFVTSMEMKNTFFLGLMTELGGCLYVERRTRENIQNEIKEISQALIDNFDVTIFPEATSTNGESILPFKRSLLKAAIDAKVPILPVTINYDKIDGIEVSKNNRDGLCWYGDMTFAPHFFQLTKYKNIQIRITAHEEIPTSEFSDRDILAKEAHSIISSHFRTFS